MTLRVSGKNLAIGEALRTHVHDRVVSLTTKYRVGAPTGHVTVEPEGSGFRADCTLFLKAGITLQVEAIAHDPYVSFDKAADRIERRLRDHRKRTTLHHADQKHGDFDPANGRELDEQADSDEDEVDGSAAFGAVIAERATDLAEMTVAGAVHAMDSAGENVKVFRFADTKRVNIVYRRADGNIGWIDPAGSVGA